MREGSEVEGEEIEATMLKIQTKEAKVAKNAVAEVVGTKELKPGKVPGPSIPIKGHGEEEPELG